MEEQEEQEEQEKEEEKEEEKEVEYLTDKKEERKKINGKEAPLANLCLVLIQYLNISAVSM